MEILQMELIEFLIDNELLDEKIETDLKPNTIWDPTKYLNIWVVNFGGDLDGEVLGYAQFPETDYIRWIKLSSFYSKLQME